MKTLLASFVPGMALVKIHKRMDVVQVRARVTPSIDGPAYPHP